MESKSNPNLLLLVSDTKIRKINSRLEAIVTNKAQLSLREKVVDRSSYTYKRPSSSSLSEPQFFGREKEEAQILELLLHEVENSDATLSIVPIVGMGGVGKTALAQRLYNDAKVKGYFERRAWVCVSHVFDVLDITKTILESITALSYKGEDLNVLQFKLKGRLSGKKFLVVLDDICNEKYEEWTALLKPFKAGAKGSKIIITTRNLTVVSITGASPYPLKELSLDNCTSLFAFHVLGATNFERHPHLESIGKEITKRCKGLPLAAKMLGGALRNKSNLNEWEDALNSIIWDLPEGENDKVLQVLKLSYVHLPSYLKRCFAYCAVFPKDYEIERDELVLLWIAEGFLERRNAKENILKLGRNHFDELVSRSFLQQSSIDASKFTMHDLLNDLAKSIVGETCFNSRESQLANNDNAPLQKARYASFISPLYAMSKCLIVCHGMKVLRSLIVGSSGDSINISDKVLHDLLIELKYLRVFSVRCFSIKKVPSCLGDLKHLRYLNFSHTTIQTLPESIGTLYKLQVLILRSCQKLSMLPPGITKLVNLQFLDIRDTISLKRMPLGIGNLKNLTILPKFVVGIERGLQLNELKNLPHLQGELLISELQKVEEVRDAVDANLIGKRGLSSLFLHWSENFGNLPNGKREELVLHSLRPHTNLEHLSISYYLGARFPSWLDGPTYSKIVSLCLRDCPNVTSLPSLGQLPSLRELSLEGLHAVSTIGPEFYGGKRPFSSLTKLKFEEMLAWKDWSPYVGGTKEEVSFSHLQHLVLRHCSSLVGTMPCQLDRLIKLEIHSCPYLNNSTNKVCLPSLHELYLEDCGKILKSLVNLTSLTTLTIKNLVELVCFDHGFMSCLTCLHGLTIESCLRFTSFVAGEGEIVLPCNLEYMNLINCTSLEKLPSKMHTLRQLSLDNCPKLTRVTIPPNGPSSDNPMYQFKSLYKWGCDSQTSFPFARSSLVALKELEIYTCKGVESLEEFTVQLLEYLEIGNCENLKSLPRCLLMLSHLTKLNIRDCPALEIEDFPPFPTTLSSFHLINCPKIKSLPNQWHHLTSLHELYVYNCPNIKCFPKGALPPHLWELAIVGCENVKRSVREWGYHRLTSLAWLEIDGSSVTGEGDNGWFPSEDEDAWSLFFPSSLIYLDIRNMKDVERLSSGLRNHLSSLQELWIYDCPKLRALPEDGFPPSLKELHRMRYSER
ncbi:hypothetical protein BT93_L3724 [Corymbia citriodora subsp. variegata]|uniref:NB-ARC domain-containing protein n=1 Tax=Corymbia citriodora subsp. variegata TaxID=360336 RepID=A0A8T0CV91_CORYI|nr:hypothetical protein BT93_L3724 [Corymbia citriodora subsp. variegata]